MLKKLFGMKGNAGVCTLNCLIKSNQDAAKGYRAGAEIVKDADVKSIFQGHAETRDRYSADLAAEVRKLGGDPAAGGSLMGKLVIPLKIMWIKMMGGDTARLVSAAESAEDCAKDKYHKALKAELPIDAHKVVELQMQGIEEAHDRIRSLERSQAAIEDHTVSERPI